LAALPGELLRRMKTTVAEADLDGFLECLAEVSSNEETLSASLRQMAEDFDYERLNELLAGEDG